MGALAIALFVFCFLPLLPLSFLISGAISLYVWRAIRA